MSGLKALAFGFRFRDDTLYALALGIYRLVAAKKGFQLLRIAHIEEIWNLWRLGLTFFCFLWCLRARAISVGDTCRGKAISVGDACQSRAISV